MIQNVRVSQNDLELLRTKMTKMSRTQNGSTGSKFFYSYFIKLLIIFHFDSFWLILGNFGSLCVISAYSGSF